MPLITTQITELTNHVAVPVAQQVARKLLNELRCRDIFADRLYFKGDFLAASKSTNNDNTVILKEDRATFTIEPNFNPMTTKWTTAQFQHLIGPLFSPRDIEGNRPVFKDSYTNMTLLEHQVPCSIVVRCKFTFMDRNIAYDIFSRLHTKYRNGEMFMQTDLCYDYRLPTDIYSILYYASQLRKVEPNLFVDYLSNYSNGGITLNYNRDDNSKRELVVLRNAFQTLSQIEYDEERPAPNVTEQSPDAYDLEFTVTMQFTRPNTLILSYPIVVCNTLLPKELIPISPMSALPPIKPKYISFDVENFVNDLPATAMVKDEFKAPWYDDWEVPMSSGFLKLGYQPFVILAVLLDDPTNEEGVTVIDLKADFGGGRLSDDLVASLQAQEVLSTYPDSKYTLTLYSNNNIVDPELLTLTDDLILTIPNRDLTPIYHLVISEREIPNGPHSCARVIIYDLVAKR